MASYLLIEARDPFESADTDRFWGLAADLVDHGDDVTVYLVQNGVLPARAGSVKAGALSRLAATSRVVADDFSLRQRGITAEELADGITPSDVDELVDLIATGDRKVVWH